MAAKGNKEPYRVLSGYCPDEGCQTRLFFPAYETSIECTGCGQRHERNTIKNPEVVTDPEVALHNMLKNVLVENTTPKKGTDSVKVLGLSNYHCKLVSPLLTTYGMDKATGEARLLKDMGQKEVFDCSILGDRAFLIEQEHIEVYGYGRDRTGSTKYLADTLEMIRKMNNDVENLLPVHADGDGHCLVHAVSRALIGRELFWHALRQNLKTHFTAKLDNYKALFQDFIDQSEWNLIIEECDPDFLPPDGEAHGLRNIHIFGLANVLKRPIILLDSMTGMQSSGDYSGVFLPAFNPPEKCRGKDGQLNKPLCLAWSSSGRNHYIPLVGIKGKPLPRLARWIIPKVWGMPNQLLDTYIQFDSEDKCVLGGEKCLPDRYIHRLVSAMDAVFINKYEVHPGLVTDMHQYCYKATGIVGIHPEVVIENTQKAVAEKRLFRCLTCDAICEFRLLSEWFVKGGSLYEVAASAPGSLVPGKKYSFPMKGLMCVYDGEKDILVPDMEQSGLSQCGWCRGTTLRTVNGDGSVAYQNGDRTTTQAGASSRCQCGFKHFWDGKEYNNLPEVLPLVLEWNGKVIPEKVYWFQHEEDSSLNSNVFDVAQRVVQKHFPGEFGSERLVQKVVNQILYLTKENNTMAAESSSTTGDTSTTEHMETDASWRQNTIPTKIVLTGQKHKTLHKEELNMSEKEKQVRQRVVENAPVQQKRRSTELARKAESEKHKGDSPKKTLSHGHDSGAPSASPPGGGGAQSEAQRVEKKIRLTTSDGRQMMLSLPGSITYAALQEKISTELHIPPTSQRIRYGFPPRELHPPEDGKEEEPLPLQHGDRVTVEILKDDNEKDKGDEIKVWQQPTVPKQAWAGFDPNAHDHSAEDLLRGLNQLQGTGDSLDMSIASLTLMATLTGKDLWTYVQGLPHLFSVGGLFYQQVERDLGLVEGKHCTLPVLPGKVFRYNAQDGRLELCLEPHGHFPVEPGLEDKILRGGIPQAVRHPIPASTSTHAATLASGGAGVVVNKPMQFPSQHVAFSGQGHSLRSNKENIRMPTDLLPATHHHHHHHAGTKNKASSFQGLSPMFAHPDSIEEESESMDTGEGASGGEEGETDAQGDSLFKRIGPGYSVVNHERTNSSNSQSEMLRSLAASIQAAVQEEAEEDLDSDENSDQEKPVDTKIQDEMDST
ncbi:deubiquitinating protein VCIP135 [Lingula anatina]|uniref:Deubiquitinating protein VCPIP1 n=1 Tax=Lingula anatina TaxID=7574 RepID=A0A1S3JGJ4_LINAN|nr:deubiquitinating protein VCIP135 [Lingula anatina]|eukprot:XP_013409530.1 deubiquitinating protein VCIP135 [Lingula anatina]